jgi:hypothetical protein
MTMLIMKKAAIILLIPLFVLSTVGLSITSLYCQGELYEIGFTVHPCCDDVNKGGCCQTTSILLRVADSFVKESKDFSFKVSGFEKPVISYSIFLITLNSHTAFRETIKSKLPEILPPGNLTYLLLCALLI